MIIKTNNDKATTNGTRDALPIHARKANERTNDADVTATVRGNTTDGARVPALDVVTLNGTNKKGRSKMERTKATAKLRDAEIIRAIGNGATNAPALARALAISESNAFYRLRKLKERGRVDADGNVVNVNAGDVQRCAVNAGDKKSADVVNVLPCELNDAEYTPNVDAEYKRRDGVDGVIERKAKQRHAVILQGDAGTGKTKCAEQVSARAGKPFLRVACDDGATLKEFIGRREIINGTTFYKLGALCAMLQRPSVILFDEFNALDARRLFFLHELLDGRRFFVKDADGGRVFNVHADAVILLACNPNGAKYSGTNKLNCALVNRCAVVDVPALDVGDVADAFNTGNDGTTDALKKYYNDARAMIQAQKMRVVLSLRNVKAIARDLRDGVNVADALAVNFYNSALLTASDKERDALAKLARVIFGITDESADGVKDGQK